MVLISIYSSAVISIVFGDEWLPAATYLSLLICAGMLMIIETLTRNFIKSLGAVKALFKYTIWKRFVGIMILLCSLLISKDYILYGYILGALIGCGFNIFLYSKLIGVSSLAIVQMLIMASLPVLLFSFLVYFSYKIFANNYITILLTISFTILYYTLILDKLGLNIKTILRR